MKTLDKKICIVVTGILLLTIIIISIFSAKTETSGSIYNKYTLRVQIEAVDYDEKKTYYNISMKDNGTIAKANVSYLNSPLYLRKNKVIYEEGNRYKEVNTIYSYKNLYKHLSKINLGDKKSEENGMSIYNPSISEENLNDILKCLFIGHITNTDENVFIGIKDDIVKDFRLYLNNIEGFKGVNILISYDKMPENEKITIPVFYEEVTDKVDNRVLKIFND